MNCKNFKINMTGYLDNALKDQEKMLFERHMQTCGKCAKEFSAVKNTRQLVLSLDRQKASPDFEKKVLKRIKSGVFTVNPFEFFFATAKTALLAAVLIFGVIITFNFFTPSIRPCTNFDNVDAINNYVLKGNVFAKENNISDAKIIQALLG